MLTSAVVSTKRKKLLNNYALTSFVIILLSAISFGIYQGFFQLPSQTVPEEAQTVLQEIVTLTDDANVKSIKVNLEDYSGSFTIEQGKISTLDYNNLGIKILSTVFYSISCFLVLLLLWALVLLLIQHFFKVRF